MVFEKVTEEESQYHGLEKMSTHEILTDINREDKTVPDAVGKAIPQIESLVTAIADKLLAGGQAVLYRRGDQWEAGCIGCQRDPTDLWYAF
jgi:N-acetylmuramic acid 6-phosphate etherase